MSTYALDPWVALGDPSRRQIFERIAQRPQSVNEIVQTVTISRPAVSQHLRVLREANLVTVRAAGTRRIHQVNPDGLRALRRDLDSYWAGVLANFKELAEQEMEP